MPHCQMEPALLLLREYLAADGDLRGCRPACYSISLHLKLIANGPSLLWKYVWTGKVHWHAVHSQDQISRNKKASPANAVLYEMISHHSVTQGKEETGFYVSYSAVNVSYSAARFGNVRTSSHLGEQLLHPA